ncbi:CDP-diacylglycerol--glycerol-3-phosphate 3-phosphatidyltransferase [Desulfitibacter alkalitolerans]|uniref:CDP-diacylglycerol--glycerol-3-phosphate 3-phosphatidyltransferase n=1 Tax=Desulfitibacter alkalitolerans TaxID=264641 RepID=UPI000480AF22|nr:CDP-diacylglycerol--glycerol-3-phosphate 3-phosphatidyltransferase [Desulfitibacter alkalitolerans]
MNLANRVTLARIFLVPIFMFFILIRIPLGEYIAAAIFVLAASTDGLDGYIARARKEVTKFGKLMDPLADKLLVSAALISLVEIDLVPAWIAVVIIGREFAVTGLRSIAASEGIVISASKLGKFKTVTQIIAIVAIILNDFFVNIIGIPFNIGEIFIYIAVIFTLWSGVDYFAKGWQVLKLNK